MAVGNGKAVTCMEMLGESAYRAPTQVWYVVVAVNCSVNMAPLTMISITACKLARPPEVNIGTIYQF
jgi:hypothetical protein